MQKCRSAAANSQWIHSGSPAAQDVVREIDDPALKVK